MIFEGDSAEQLLQEAEREDTETLKFLISDSVADTHAKLDRSYRGVWFNNYYTDDATRKANLSLLAELTGSERGSRNLPNFTVISIA
jgi:hypothetical protein